jgi:hypothetical protein
MTKSIKSGSKLRIGLNMFDRLDKNSELLTSRKIRCERNICDRLDNIEFR